MRESKDELIRIPTYKTYDSSKKGAVPDSSEEGRSSSRLKNFPKYYIAPVKLDLAKRDLSVREPL